MDHTADTLIPVNPSDFACIDLINSTFTDYLTGRRVDRMSSTEWQRWFLERYELRPERPDAPPLHELVTLRRDLRRILEKWSRGEVLSRRDMRVLDDRISAAPVRNRVTGASGAIELVAEPVQSDWTWVMASVSASAVDLVLTGDARRLKTCTNPNCSWMFYDTTVNRSKQFCSVTPCALLIRVRRFREGR